MLDDIAHDTSLDRWSQEIPYANGGSSFRSAASNCISEHVVRVGVYAYNGMLVDGFDSDLGGEALKLECEPEHSSSGSTEDPHSTVSLA